MFVLDERFGLVDCNSLFEGWCPAVFGLRAEKGQGLLDGLEMQERQFWSEIFQRAIGGDTFELLRKVETDNGSLQLEFMFQPLAELRGLVACVTDVTKWHRRQAELEEAIQSRDLMMSVVGHDLRTPIFQLNGLLYLLRNIPRGIEAERLNSYIDDIDGNLSYLGDAIENLLQWASSRRDRPLLQRQSVCARVVLDQVLALLKPMALSKGIDIQIESDNRLPLDVDPSMLAFVMRNLLGNAVKFSPSGTSIHVRQSLSEGRFEFQVIDHGVGMKPDDINKLISGVSTRSQIGTKGEKGFGLGLRLCQDFVSVHGGKINFSPTEGGGLVVAVDIPQQAAESA